MIKRFFFLPFVLLALLSTPLHGQDFRSLAIFDWVNGDTTEVEITTPVIDGLPTITGTAEVGNLLTAHAADVSGGQIVTTWQWERDGTEIEGATSNTYLLTTDDYGVTITVVQTATNSEGSDTAESEGTDVAALAVPVITGVPTISGTLIVPNVLTVTPATVTGDLVTTTYQWERDGTEIEGETNTTYTLTDSDYGVDITVVQTSTNAAGSDTAESAAASIAAKPNIASITTSSPIIVEYGTTFEELLLPTEVEVTLDDATTRDLTVTWAEGTYDGDVADDYVLEGTVTLDSDITNTESLKASITVTVLEDGAVLNPYLTFADSVDRGGGNCKSVIREGISYKGGFNPPTGYSVTEWAIIRINKSKTVHVRGTGSTVTWTPDFVSMDSANVYDLYAKISDGEQEYEYRWAGEFWVFPTVPSSYTATYNSSQQLDFNWADHTGDAYKITGSISTRFGLWELQSSDPTDPVHIVCDAATITADNAFHVLGIGPWKNVILDGCTGEDYGLTLVKPATATQGQLFFDTNNTSSEQLSSNVWIAGVHAYSPSIRDKNTSVASFRTNTVKNSTVNESNYEVTGYILAETKVTNAGVEAHYHGQSNDAIESGRRYPHFAGMLFFNNIVDGAGNDGFQMQQQFYDDYNGNGYYDPKSDEWDTSPKDDPAMFFHNEGYNVGQHNTSDHYNLFQFTPAHVGSIAFGNYGETTHNTVYLNNGTHGQDFEFFSNVTYSTGRDASVGVNYFMSLTNGDSTTAVAIFKNNTSQVASGDMFTLFHGATTTNYDKLYVKANAFINDTGEDWELGGSGWNTATEIDFDNITVTDIDELEFVDGAEKDFHPATTDGLLWADHGTVPSKTFYSQYDFDGYKFVDTAPIAGAFSGVPTLISGGVTPTIYTITSVDTSTPISVEFGTAWPPGTLPTQVTANLSNGGTELIDVSWSQGDYDANTADTYTLEGTLTNLPSNITNPDGFKGSIDVTVEEEEEEGFDADYQAVLDRATTLGYTLPSSGDQILQNQLVLDLKSAGIWAKLDIFYVFATDGSSNFSLLNWKAPSSFQATLSGTAPTFTSNSGWAGNGFSSFMDLNWTPSTNGVQYTQNDAAILVGVATNVSSNTDCEFGATQGGFTNRTTLNTRTTSNTAFIAINGNNTTEISNSSSTGNYILQRTSSTAVKLFKNGSQLGSTASLASTGRPAAEMHLLEETNVGNQSARRITHFGAGASLNGLESSFNTAWTTYMSGL